MTDPWGVPQNNQPQDPQSSGSGYPQQNPYGAPPQFGAPIPPQYDPNAAPYDPNAAAQQPQPPQFGQVPPPQFGAPAPGPYAGDPMGTPAYGYPVAQPKQSNGLSLAGAITSFIPVVGLVLSIIGLARSKALGGAGRTAGTVGIVLSLLFSAGWGFGIYKIGTSTAADPGCISAESGVRGLISTLEADNTALTTAESSGDQSQLTTAEQKYVTDMNSFKSIMDHSESIATHANVKAAIQKIDTDLATFIKEFQQLISGSSSDSTGLETSADALQPDGNALDNLCGDVTNGG